MTPTLLLVDTTGLIFRAFFSISPLTSPAGVPVNATFGVLRILLKVFREVHADAAAFVFDAGKETFRNEMFADYKAHRPEPPDDLRPQFELTHRMALATQTQVFMERGFEADDIIATLAKQAQEQGYAVKILTGDKDIFQLINDSVEILLPAKRGELQSFSQAEFASKYNFDVSRFVDFKALMGDPSDNIPGIPGVGEKTAAKLVANYGKLEQIYGNLDLVKPPTLAAKLREHESSVQLYRDLVTLNSAAPVKYDFTGRKLPNFADSSLLDLISEMGFNCLKEDAQTAGDLESSRGG
jgi:DNA polymerase-1